MDGLVPCGLSSAHFFTFYILFMRIFLLFSFLCAAVVGNAQGIDFFHGTWQEALDKAKAENRYIFVDAFTTWCGPCKKMSRETFPDASVGSYFNKNFINVKLDMEDGGDGSAVAEQFAVNSFPTYLFLSPDGQLAYRSVGYMVPEDFVALGKEVFVEAPKMARLTKAYTAGDRTPEVLYGYAKGLKKMNDERSVQVAEEYLDAQKNWSDPQAIELIVDNFGDADHRAFQYAHAHKNEFVGVVGEEVFDDFVSTAVTQACIALYSQNGKLPEKEGKALFAKYLPERGEKLFYFFRVQLYNYAEDWNNYPSAAVDYVAKYPQEMDAATYNAFAWTFYEQVEDQAMLEKALEWVLASIKLEKGYFNMDTAAALYYKLGNKGKAKKYAQEAIKLGKSEGEDVSGTESLLEQINRM
jgi:thioredoxin-related protein